jgi:hypothetical protein
VAQAYLTLADPEDEDGRIRLSESKDAFAPGARVSLADWSRTMKGAHLASAAIRLASIDEVLDRANDGRAPSIRNAASISGRARPSLMILPGAHARSGSTSLPPQAVTG